NVYRRHYFDVCVRRRRAPATPTSSRFDVGMNRHTATNSRCFRNQLNSPQRDATHGMRTGSTRCACHLR
ncbi:hypothetical protein BE221DRAFT_163038, partial [Ostreococcus tauri]